MSSQSTTPTAQSTTSSSCACLPCDIPAFCRTGYYTGKLLTARDFTNEQTYHINKLRLHHMALHGWGAVCGLKVKHHPHCPGLRIIVEPGFAIDQCGREVQLRAEVELCLPLPPPPKPPDPCPPDPASPPDCEPDEPPPSESLWICLRYCETPQQYSPAPFDECACTGTAQKPNCICESYCLEITTTEPACVKAIEKHKDCGCDDCRDWFKGMLDPCENVPCDCLPLAVIRDYKPGKVVTDNMIDNWTVRPFLPSVHRLDQLVRCLLEKIPQRTLTHISDINWTHGSELRCHEFMNRYIGRERGFDLKFDRPVKPEGISRRTFQAMVVLHGARPEQGQRMEIAPAQVEILSPTHIRLRIDEHYARASLDRHTFELYITLKCDVIVDHDGNPVDGDLLARLESDGEAYFVDAPTGDGVPGGLFESWIRVQGGGSEPR
jgi:hypothetical protein